MYLINQIMPSTSRCDILLLNSWLHRLAQKKGGKTSLNLQICDSFG